jgi:hypothetical protein
MLQDLRLDLLNLDHLAFFGLTVLFAVPDLAAFVHDYLGHGFSDQVTPATRMMTITPNRPSRITCCPMKNLRPALSARRRCNAHSAYFAPEM